jgi:hypothetical protein
MKKAEDAAKTVASMAEVVRATVPLPLPGRLLRHLNEPSANAHGCGRAGEGGEGSHVPMKLPIPVKVRIVLSRK